MIALRTSLLAALVLPLAACMSGPSVSPVEITRFHQPAALADLGTGRIFVETAPGLAADPALLAPYKAAVAAELTRIGYSEAARSDAGHIAEVRVERFVARPAEKRSPVSVGGGASTGSYGGGVGLGIGINLGGGQREMIGTDLGVVIRDAASGAVVWEGRASISVSDNSDFADSRANASVIASALFREFPGNNGETVEVKVAQ